jgi:hypothetical protein
MVMEGRQVELESCFANVQKVASVYHPYSMPYEHFDVFYCRTPVQSHSFPRRARDRRRHFRARLGSAVLQSFCLLEAHGVFLAALRKQQYSLNF